MTDNYYIRPEISNSDLTMFDYAGARNFNHAKNKLMEDKDKQLRDTKSMKKGRAIHSRILLPDYYIENYLPMNVEYPKAQQKGFCDGADGGVGWGRSPSAAGKNDARDSEFTGGGMSAKVNNEWGSVNQYRRCGGGGQDDACPRIGQELRCVSDRGGVR